MEAKIKKAVDKFKDKVSSVRTGGRFNPQSIESVRVVADKNSKETVRLGDLAQVIPKGGRMVAILAGDEEVSLSISLSSSFVCKLGEAFFFLRQFVRLLILLLLLIVPKTHIVRPDHVAILTEPANRPTQRSAVERAHPTTDKGVPRG